MYYEYEGSKGGVYYIEVSKNYITGGEIHSSGYKSDLYRFGLFGSVWATANTVQLPHNIDKAIEYSELLDKVVNEVKLTMNKDKAQALNNGCACDDLGSECPACENEE